MFSSENCFYVSKILFSKIPTEMPGQNDLSVISIWNVIRSDILSALN